MFRECLLTSLCSVIWIYELFFNKIHVMKWTNKKKKNKCVWMMKCMVCMSNCCYSNKTSLTIVQYNSFFLYYEYWWQNTNLGVNSCTVYSCFLKTLYKLTVVDFNISTVIKKHFFYFFNLIRHLPDSKCN